MAFITVEQGENASTDANDFAAIVNESTTVTTRYGGEKLSVDQALSRIIVGEVEVYNAASTYLNIEDWVEYSGVVYRPLPSALPIGPEAFNAAHWAVAQGFATADNTSYNSTTVGAYLDGQETIRASDYAELRAIDVSLLSSGDVVQVAERTVGLGGGGPFVWFDSDLSADVTTDTQSGIYVAPDSDLTGASGGYVRRIVNTITVREFGAVLDGNTDDYTAIYSSLAVTDKATIPDNVLCNTETTIYLDFKQTLKIGSQSELRRPIGAGEGKVVWLAGNSAALLGEGTSSIVRSYARCPDGAVLIGHEDMETSHANVNFCTVKNVWISGPDQFGQTTGNPDAALTIRCPQLSARTVYFNCIENVGVANANYGIWFHGWANGNRVSNIHIQRIGNTTLANNMIYIQGGLDNAITNVFFHGSLNSTAIVIEDLDNTAVSGGFNHVSNFNNMTNMVAEQGGSTEKFIDAALSTGVSNIIQGASNTTLYGDIADQFRIKNTFITSSYTKIKDRKNPGSFTELTIASGKVTIDELCHSIASESGVSDTLHTIEGGVAGDFITLKGSAGDVITIEDGTGNINCSGSVNIVLSSGSDKINLICDGAVWSTSPLWDVS